MRPRPPHQVGRPKARAKDWRGTLRRLWSYLAVHKRLLTLVLVMVLLSSALGLLGPYLLGRAIDAYLVPREREGLLWFIALLAGNYVFFSAATWLQNYWMIGIAQRTVATLREDLFRQLHRLPIAYFSRRKHGELMSRLTNDIENVSQTLNTSFVQVFTSVLTFAGMLGMMLWLSLWLTLITLTIIPLMVLGMKWITSRTGPRFREQQRNLGELNGFVEETLSGQQIVKTFSREQAMIEAFAERNARLRVSGYWAQVYTGFIPKLMNMLNNISFALIAGIGGLLAMQQLVSIGVIVTFAEYARQFTRPLNDLANQFNTILAAIAGAERVFEVLEEAPESGDEQAAVELERVRGEIVFEAVDFSYEPGVRTLRGIDLHVAPGQTLALVGSTGAGKSTIVQLISRFYAPDRGRILIDGRDIAGIRRHSLRSHMGFVLQDVFLFQDTIRENIRYGRLEATDAEVEEAARLANAHGFIAKLPRGYDTVLGQDGGGISQGQRQLLSIARAMLAGPSILVLDEATSSVDTVTEIKIQEALYRLMQGRTNIVIAHRLGTIRRADQIAVVEDGQIVERGSHESLLQARGRYYDLVHAGEREAGA
ncbi:ABC transporter ATP-binding protein [Paenibacillus sp. IB182496]|uniref:ABC transporter ATP-binding protein n=1 Tax=Paenibacillus sabuli TaxID=2772509 RepID=A0A927BX17_9BACL|nr:ABC transporter ATP-binding protein [Paenibacillus sabuli]MBD2846908.1 ABC transporter ATP-binding protein [Paenibacillus sabuli]